MTVQTLFILVLGILAFSLATAAGLIMAKIMNLFLKEKINPLIGSAGVSAVPMAARVSNKVGLEYNPQNFPVHPKVILHLLLYCFNYFLNCFF